MCVCIPGVVFDLGFGFALRFALDCARSDGGALLASAAAAAATVGLIGGRITAGGGRRQGPGVLVLFTAAVEVRVSGRGGGGWGWWCECVIEWVGWICCGLLLLWLLLCRCCGRCIDAVCVHVLLLL